MGILMLWEVLFVSNNEEWADKMVFAQKALGLQPSPFDCWLIQRGLQKLKASELQVHSENKLEKFAYISH